MGIVTTIGKLLLKDKKGTVGVIKKVTGGVEAITGIAPTVSKELSQAAKAKRLQGFFKRLKNKKKK
jgi:hypothetical protein